MALFDFTGSIDVPDDITKITKTDTSNDKESDSMPIIDNEDKKKENIQPENETQKVPEEENNKNIISDSTDTIIEENNSNAELSQEIDPKITPDKTEKSISLNTPVNLENTDLPSVNISGVVFFDEYLDSIYHKYSIGINNIVLKLYDKDNKLIAKTISRNYMHNSGYFEFNNIQPGKYKITFSTPGDMFISPQQIRKYYGSKASRYKKAVIINIGESDVSNVFIGLYK